MAIQHKDIVESGLHETKGVSVAPSGAILKAQTGVGQWGWQEYYLNLDIADIDVSGSYFIPVPHTGNVAYIYCAIDNAITIADNTITASIAGVDIPNGVVIITFTGSGAGSVYSAVPTSLNFMTAGQSLRLTVSGASTTACRAHITIAYFRSA